MYSSLKDPLVGDKLAITFRIPGWKTTIFIVEKLKKISVVHTYLFCQLFGNINRQFVSRDR